MAVAVALWLDLIATLPAQVPDRELPGRKHVLLDLKNIIGILAFACNGQEAGAGRERAKGSNSRSYTEAHKSAVCDSRHPPRPRQSTAAPTACARTWACLAAPLSQEEVAQVGVKMCRKVEGGQ